MSKLPKTNEQIVREKYPLADAIHYPSKSVSGRAEPTPEEWVIAVAPGLGERVLGRGTSLSAAWESAAAEVLDDLRRPTGVEIPRETWFDVTRHENEPLIAEGISQLGEELPVHIKELDGSKTKIELPADGLEDKP